MLAIISGMTKDRVIGKGTELPWHIPDDLQNFKKVTTGKTVVMGLTTFESLGKPLPNRKNIVINFEKIDIPGVDVCTSIPEAIEKAKSYGEDVFIIGGASIYKQTLDLVDTMFLSHIKKNYEGDVYFPEFNEDDWEIVDREDFPEFEFVTYKRK